MNIIELAKQANGEPAWNGGVDWTWDELEAFAALVAAAARADEREACAKMVDHILKEGGGTWGDAIRARGADMTGYQSKKAAALDKLDDDDTQMYQRPWVGLTDEEIKAIDEMALTKNMAIAMTMRTLKEKNT